jgi:hypothetical protein
MSASRSSVSCWRVAGPFGFRSGRVHALQVERSVNGVFAQLGADLASHAPDVAHVGGLYQGLQHKLMDCLT